MPETSLTFQQFREANVQRNSSETWGDSVWSYKDWMIALIGEVGELANNLKKIHRATSYTGMAFPNRKDLAGELGDIQTYLDLLAWSLGIDLEQATKEKWNEVSERWGLSDRL